MIEGFQVRISSFARFNTGILLPFHSLSEAEMLFMSLSNVVPSCFRILLLVNFAVQNLDVTNNIFPLVTTLCIPYLL